jgi:hypothetical protein
VLGMRQVEVGVCGGGCLANGAEASSRDHTTVSPVRLAKQSLPSLMLNPRRV